MIVRRMIMIHLEYPKMVTVIGADELHLIVMDGEDTMVLIRLPMRRDYSDVSIEYGMKLSWDWVTRIMMHYWMHCLIVVPLQASPPALASQRVGSRSMGGVKHELKLVMMMLANNHHPFYRT